MSDEFISLVPPPGYEIPGMVVKSLQNVGALERARTFIGILGPVFSEFVHDQRLAVTIEAEIDKLLPLIEKRVSSGTVGYLLSVNLYRDPVNGALRAAPQLISAIGAGVEPIDALAEAIRTKYISSPPCGTVHVRLYRWCTKRDDTLAVACLDEVVGAQLERQAEIEARRRHLLGAFYVDDREHGLAIVARAQFWQIVTDQRRHRLSKQRDRLRMDELNRRFRAAQDRFNQAYADYQNAARQLANVTRQAELFAAVATVVGLLRTGLAAQASLSAVPSDDPEAMRRWQEHQRNIMSAAQAAAARELDELLPQIRALDGELREEWRRLQIPAPQDDWIPPQLPPLPRPH